MNKEYSFNAKIIDAGGGGSFVRIPLDVKQVFSKKRVPVSSSKEYVGAILDARREETRRNRITKTIQMLLETIKDS